jgi:phosphatidylglycerophosphatase A
MNDRVKPRLLTSPAQLLAFGFGSGLSPKAPGTMGTLAAIPLYLALSQLSLPLYSLAVIVSIVAGIWICGRASAEMKVHDHPGIVWDEFVGFWITLWAIPAQWPWVLAGFVVFRLFDIAKPWPISWLDRNVHGGWGIMVDDILAGIFSCALLHLAGFFLSTM